MSTANLQRFLEYLIVDLESKDIDYRKSVANREEHVFATSAKRIVTQTVYELEAQGIKVRSVQMVKLRAEARKAFKLISDKAKASIKRHEKAFGLRRNRNTRFTADSLVVVYESPEGHNSDIFAKVKRTYENALDAYFLSVYAIFITDADKLPDSRGGAFHAGHAQDQGVFEFRVSSAVNKALHDIGDHDLLTFIEKSRTRVAATLRATMSKDATKMNIIIESASANIEDSNKVNVKRDKLLEAAKTAVDKITSGKGFPYFEGSDSPIEAAGKRTIKEINKSFSKVKGLKATHIESTKPNPSGNKASVKVKTRTTQRKVAISRKERKGPRVKGGTDTSLLTIMADINAKLRDVIQANMVSPALVYDTGEFAGSVEIGTPTKTARGFVNIPYRYQFSPYSVFDFAKGKAPWNIPDRDPDILIDKSIRQIVGDRLGARFYTNRNYLWLD